MQTLQSQWEAQDNAMLDEYDLIAEEMRDTVKMFREYEEKDNSIE